MDWSHLEYELSSNRGKQKGREDKEDVHSYWMTLRKSEDTVNLDARYL